MNCKKVSNMITQEEHDKILIQKQKEKILSLEKEIRDLKNELDLIKEKFPIQFKLIDRYSYPTSFEWSGNGFSPETVHCTEYCKTTFTCKVNSLEDLLKGNIECIDKDKNTSTVKEWVH